MKRMSSKTHGVLDYIVGLALIAAPWLFGFASNGADTQVPVTLGILTILYSLVTRYEMGAIKWLGFRSHLVLDFLSGMLLAASPWLFNFADKVYTPHLTAGVLEMLVVVFTEPVANRSFIVKREDATINETTIVE
jgi:hypothetical protein